MTVKTLAEAKEVCPTTTRRLLGEGALLVDVRESNEVAALAFDVDNVVNLPLSQFEQRWAELPRDRELVLVCETGARSLKATYFLQYQGFERVANMGGGLAKWMTKGFPVKGHRSDPGAPAAATTGCRGSAPVSSCCDPSNGCCEPGTSFATGSCCDATTPAASPCCAADAAQAKSSCCG